MKGGIRYGTRMIAGVTCKEKDTQGFALRRLAMNYDADTLMLDSLCSAKNKQRINQSSPTVDSSTWSLPSHKSCAYATSVSHFEDPRNSNQSASRHQVLGFVDPSLLLWRRMQGKNRESQASIPGLSPTYIRPADWARGRRK